MNLLNEEYEYPGFEKTRKPVETISTTEKTFLLFPPVSFNNRGYKLFIYFKLVFIAISLRTLSTSVVVFIFIVTALIAPYFFDDLNSSFML
jgi:hypothetical protein